MEHNSQVRSQIQNLLDSIYFRRSFTMLLTQETSLTFSLLLLLRHIPHSLMQLAFLGHTQLFNSSYYIG